MAVRLAFLTADSTAATKDDHGAENLVGLTVVHWACQQVAMTVAYWAAHSVVTMVNHAAVSLADTTAARLGSPQAVNWAEHLAEHLAAMKDDQTAVD